MRFSTKAKQKRLLLTNPFTAQTVILHTRILQTSHSDMAHQQPPDAGEPNDALQDMVSDPSMETGDNDDDEHAFETSKDP